MVFYLNSEHPKDALLFYVASRSDEKVIEALGEMIDSLASARSWVIHPPYFVHQEEEMLDPQTGQPIVTVGGLLEMYTAHGSWRNELPREVDEAHYVECRLLIEQVAAISRRYGIELHFEFQGEMVGTIVAGELDEQLATQFLGTWGLALGRREG
jgi:hypothetical protein